VFPFKGKPPRTKGSKKTAPLFDPFDETTPTDDHHPGVNQDNVSRSRENTYTGGANSRSFVVSVDVPATMEIHYMHRLKTNHRGGRNLPIWTAQAAFGAADPRDLTRPDFHWTLQNVMPDTVSFGGSDKVPHSLRQSGFSIVREYDLKGPSWCGRVSIMARDASSLYGVDLATVLSEEDSMETFRYALRGNEWVGV
jgi:hypothetical protein